MDGALSAAREAGRIGVRRAAMVIGSLTIVAGCLTTTFLGMRRVMEIGGACAEGGPFVPIRPCPDGVPALMGISIPLGVLAAFAYITATPDGFPNLAGFFWSALFGSLGWNFFEFGVDPPGGGGLEWGWLICGAVFVLMAIGPFILVMVGGLGTNSASRVNAARATVAKRVGPAQDRRGPGADGLVDELERLHALVIAGGLSPEEYARAKATLLGEDRP